MEKVLALTPSHLAAIVLLADAYLNMGKFEKARLALKSAKEVLAEDTKLRTPDKQFMKAYTDYRAIELRRIILGKPIPGGLRLIDQINALPRWWPWRYWFWIYPIQHLQIPPGRNAKRAG
ncbi:MAG: tetratricopeptide repeat protein [Pseudomonadota bacterium]